MSPRGEFVADRRAFIGNVAIGLLASAFSTFAQQPAKVPRIGLVGNVDASTWEAFRQSMRELGYIDGRNIAMLWRWAEGNNDRFREIASELVAMKVDLIVTTGVQGSMAAKQATSSIPIVMATVAFPDRVGLVTNLAQPGGNLTGFSNFAGELMGKRLELLKEIAPKVSRVAVLWNPANPVEPFGFRELQAAADVLGLEVRSIEVRSPDQQTAAFAAVTASRSDAMSVGVNIVNSKIRQQIADFALRTRVPTITDDRSFVDAGMLLSYGPSYVDLYRRTAVYVDKILKGAKPGDLPVQQPTEFELMINLKTAKALGLTIPRLLLARAEVIQ